MDKVLNAKGAVIAPFFARNFHASTVARVAVAGIVPVEVDLRAVPVAVRNLVVREPCMSCFVLVSGNLL